MKKGGIKMPLTISPKYNDTLQKLVLLSPIVSDLTFGIIEKIDNEALTNSEELTIALLERSFELIGATPSSIDSFITILLELERSKALSHDEAQAFTYLALDLGRS
jgi:hypothetical protein